MRQSLLARFAKRSVQQGQVGQTIVIMAFAFIILLAFVGIVTDVSLMFVRYTTLRRAVDAAAVAAAGQIRRAIPTDAELAKAGQNVTLANGYAFARSVANINLAARQFIEFYGLNPSNVAVDSCDTLVLDSTKPGYSDPHNQDLIKTLQCGQHDKPRKLVQVTAQVQSPTVFLRLIGWGTVTLEASAVSETAVLDVVLIFDAAESMLKQTTYNEWASVPVVNNGQLVYDANGKLTTQDKSLRFLPVRVDSGPNYANRNALYQNWAATGGNWATAWKLLLNMTQNDIYADKTNFPVVPFTWNGTTATYVDPLSATYAQNAPRQDCTVRFYPYAETVSTRAMLWEKTSTNLVETDLQNSYNALLKQKGVITGTGTDVYPGVFDGFMPAYDYFGCCNDPNGDFNFNDLICQPFGKVRTATEKFLDHLDFVRGDRVAFVTFDRSANVIDPDGKNGSQLAMITSQDNALDALRSEVGVRAEPNFYADVNRDGRWDAFVTGGVPYDETSTGGIPIRYNDRWNFAAGAYQNSDPAKAGYNNTRLGLLNNYPVRYNCIFDNATLTYPFSLFSAQANYTNYTYYTNGVSVPAQIFYPFDYLDSTHTTTCNTANPCVDSRWPTPLAAMSGTPAMNPNLNDPLWNTSMKSSTLNPGWSTKDYARQTAKGLYSYEFRAECGGNNVGAALRAANNALLDPQTVRTGNSGAVWVMVLLGDGAAGASDPVQRNGVQMVVADPYKDGLNTPPTGASYGAYGLCPSGSPGDQMGLTSGWNPAPPRCSDDGSEASSGGNRGIMGAVTRHFCSDSAIKSGTNMTIDIGKSSDCVDKYDVDDYARDWADYVGLTVLPATTPFCHPYDQTCLDRTGTQFPTIFTIGFGLDFPNGDQTVANKCSGDPAPTPTSNIFTNINDCLGEELLRYIADVGDNNHMDIDYEQDWVNDGAMNGITSDGQYLYGDRGPCESPIKNFSNAASAAQNGRYDLIEQSPFPSGKSCGNYYNAPGGPELTKVFEDIASRMFTRITK